MINHFIIIVLYIVEITAKIYFKEEFTDDDWQKRWLVSEHPSNDWGTFVSSPGRYYGDPEINKGIQTSENGKFYALTTKFEPFSNEDKVLVIQYSVKYEQDIKCGGAYIKLFDCTLDPIKFHSYKPYLIQFGPDICTFKKVHVIFNYKGRKLAMKRQLQCVDNRLTHLYTLVIKPDNTYLIKIDNKIQRSGKLEEDWDFLPPTLKRDTKVTKPLDWNDSLKTIDLTVKPQNWSQENPEFHSTDEEEAIEDLKPMLTVNPDNKSDWKYKLNHKGQRIDSFTENPVYLPDSDFYRYDEICGIGFDIWQVESGTIFDNILITDDELEAEKHGNDTWGITKEKEKLMKIKYDKLTGMEIENVTVDLKHRHDEL